MEELELSEQCRLGNNQARKELYEQYAGRMLGIFFVIPATVIQPRICFTTAL